jgi:hypothetical protein
MYYSPSMSTTNFLSGFLYQMTIYVFLKRFCKSSQKMGSYQPLAIWKVHYLYTTIHQTCHMARGHLNPQAATILSISFYVYWNITYHMAGG